MGSRNSTSGCVSKCIDRGTRTPTRTPGSQWPYLQALKGENECVHPPTDEWPCYAMDTTQPWKECLLTRAAPWMDLENIIYVT